MVGNPIDTTEIRRRLRAARALAVPSEAELDGEPDPGRGITVEELTARLQPEWPISAKTIGAIERGEREARPMELRTIAAACSLPYEFFTADFAVLGDAPTGLVERMARLEELLSRFAPLAELDADETETLDRRQQRNGRQTGARAPAPRKKTGA